MSIFDEMKKDAPSFTRAPSQGDLSRLTALGKELAALDARLVRYEEVKKEILERMTKIQMSEMVDLMDEIHQDRIGLPDEGVDLVLSDYFKASLPNPDTVKTDEEKIEYARLRAEGIAFLTLDAPDLLTTEVVITMPKGSMEKAREIVAMITSEQGFGLEPRRVTVTEGVHWGALTSYIKEQIGKLKRDDIPLEPLGATVGRIVKIVKRKTS